LRFRFAPPLSHATFFPVDSAMALALNAGHPTDPPSPEAFGRCRIRRRRFQ